MRRTILILTALFLILLAGCVKVNWLPVDPDELSWTKIPDHPEIHAEILYKKMDVWAYGRKVSDIAPSRKTIYEFKQQRKIYSQEGMDYATIHIPAYRYSGFMEIAARTIHPDGSIVDLDPKTIYDKKIDDLKFKSFTFPDVTPGSILEYHYSFESERFVYILPFIFHDTVPVRHVEYNFYRTGGLSYILSYRNKPEYIKLEHSTLKLAAGKFEVLSLKGDNLPMIKEEFLGATAERNGMEVLAVLSRYRLEKVIETWGDMIPYINYKAQIDKIPETNQILREVGVNPENTSLVISTLLKWVQENIEFNGTRGLSFISKSSKATYDDRYGSNEDLAVLLMGMLKEAGIRVYPVLTRFYTNGKPVSSFPYPYQFDHILVVAEVGFEKYYLDPSVSFAEVNEPYWKSQNVEAVILKRNDIEIVTTPGSDYIENSSVGVHTISNIENNRIDIQTDIQYTGISLGFINSLKKNDDERKNERVVNYIQDDLTTAVVDTFLIGDKSMSITYHSDGYALKTRDRIIINPNVFRRYEHSATWGDERYSNFYYSYPYLIKDIYNITIPKGYEVESLPTNYILEDKQTGLYFYYKTKVTDGSIIITRERQTQKRVVARGLFEKVNEYYSMLMASDNEEIILKRID